MLLTDLFESRPGYLYHGTGPDEAESILGTNTILAKTDHLMSRVSRARPKDENAYGRIEGVSLSRSPHMPRRWKSGDGVVFVLEQTRLRQRYRMLPHDYYIGSASRRRSEAEEYLVGPITNLDRYLVAIEISQATLDSLNDDNDQYLPGEGPHALLLNHPKLKVVGQRWDRLDGRPLKEDVEFDSALTQGVDLSTPHAFMASMRRIPREQVAALQAKLNAVVPKAPENWTRVYHGAPTEIADIIDATGFALTKGRRGGWLGSINEVENLGIFMTDDKAMAEYFGSNRSRYGNDYRVIEAYIDTSNFLDSEKPPASVQRIALARLERWDGVKRRRVPKSQWWWVLDQPDVVDAIKAAGFKGVRFCEELAVRREAGSKGTTYFVFDPTSIFRKPASIPYFVEWLRRHSTN